MAPSEQLIKRTAMTASWQASRIRNRLQRIMSLSFLKCVTWISRGPRPLNKEMFKLPKPTQYLGLASKSWSKPWLESSLIIGGQWCSRFLVSLHSDHLASLWSFKLSKQSNSLPSIGKLVWHSTFLLRLVHFISRKARTLYLTVFACRQQIYRT